jgi:hypothetical protein
MAEGLAPWDNFMKFSDVVPAPAAMAKGANNAIIINGINIFAAFFTIPHSPYCFETTFTFYIIITIKSILFNPGKNNALPDTTNFCPRSKRHARTSRIKKAGSTAGPQLLIILSCLCFQ